MFIVPSMFIEYAPKLFKIKKIDLAAKAIPGTPRTAL